MENSKNTTDHRNIDDIYKSVPIDKIPWNIKTPPDALIELVESKKVQPCKTIDLGCGAGNYAIYLAQQGFEVTGIDISPTAIEIAREQAKKKGITPEPPHVRNASGREASTMIWRMSAIQPVTTHFSKCWEIFLLEIILKKTLLNLHGI